MTPDSNLVRYLSHPQIIMDVEKDVQRWSLNELGCTRVEAVLGSEHLRKTSLVISSGETKAIETAEPIAKALNCEFAIRENMYENDRSATGFLPPDEFEKVADEFFAKPNNNVRGWEKAVDAQIRVLTEVQACLKHHDPSKGDVLFVGHGGVGTLLYCALSDIEIDRSYDQPAGGGNFFAFDQETPKPLHGWLPMEQFLNLFES